MRRKKRTDRLIGPTEIAAAAGAVLITVGLWMIYLPLALIWWGGLALGFVWMTMPTPKPRIDRED